MPKSDLEYLQILRNKVESHLKWGRSEDWLNYDFEKLSLEIEFKTKVVLSVSTLKRIWGKVKSSHSPSITTLNTLAQFLDYDDWRTFKQDEGIAKKTADTLKKTLAIGVSTNVKKANKTLFFTISGVFMVLVVGAFYFLKRTNTQPNAADFEFEANKIVTQGVPNSVIFSYNASKAKTDSVFIVQTWDSSRKTLVPKEGSNHSAMYYYPGYFRSKLIIDNTIVKTHDIQITTDGWLCLVETENHPIYFKKEDSEEHGIIRVNDTLLSKYNVSTIPKSPLLRFFNQRDLGNLVTSDFTFETTLKNEVNREINACQQVQVLIQCKDDIIIIPLVSKPCVGEVYLAALGFGISSKQADLSKFGADLEQWTHLKVVGKEKTLKFYVNGIEAYSVDYPNEPSGIVGVQYRFYGGGAVKDTKFENKEGIIKM